MRHLVTDSPLQLPLLPEHRDGQQVDLGTIGGPGYPPRLPRRAAEALHRRVHRDAQRFARMEKGARSKDLDFHRDDLARRKALFALVQ